MKNKILILLIIPFLFPACTYAESKKETSVSNLNSGFSLSQDTIFINIKGEMTHALKYKDKFYVLFEQRVLEYGGYGKRWLYIFSNGQLEKVIDCPKEMETIYLDFYVKNNNLILKPYMDNQFYQLDLNSYIWNEIDKTDDLIFEDDFFQVYSLDFGEWGGKTWFKDRKTGLEYVIESTTPLVNKIDSIYYLTNPFKVIEISNPLKLNICDDDITYENIEKTNKYYSWYGEPKGFKIIYEDTTFNYFDYSYKPHLVSSFVLNDKLLHIYETDTAIYVARIGKNTIEIIEKIGEDLQFYNWHYSYRCKNLNGNNELLKFNTKDEQVYGLMEINDSKISMHYFINKAELNPKIIGAEKADSIFVNRLNTILADLSNLTLNRIDLKEQIWGSFDITPNHTIGVGSEWNPNNYPIDTCRSYLIKEDSIFSNTILYYGTKENSLVRVVSIDWDYESNLVNNDSEEYAKKTFDKKVEFLINYITKNIGKQIKKDDKKDFIERTWETSSGITLHLSYNKKYYGVRLVIYKNNK